VAHFCPNPLSTPGRAFALQEMTLVLATIAQQYKLDFVDNAISSVYIIGKSSNKRQKEVKPSATMTLRPSGAVKLRLQKRDL
jgi:hypothetical protein